MGLGLKNVSPNDCAAPMRPSRPYPEVNARSLCRSSKTSPLHTKQVVRRMIPYSISQTLLYDTQAFHASPWPALSSTHSTSEPSISNHINYSNLPEHTQLQITFLRKLSYIHHGSLRIKTRLRTRLRRPASALRQPKARPMGSATIPTR
jgi:hypothetical protein